MTYYGTYPAKGKVTGGLNTVLANTDLINEVMPFWYTLINERTITDLYTPANPNIPMVAPLSALKAAGVLIIPTITDGTAPQDPVTKKYPQLVLSNLMANSVSRANLVTTITNLVMTNQFDGIDLDFEEFAFQDSSATWLHR